MNNTPAKKKPLGMPMWLLRDRCIEGWPNYLSKTQEYTDQQRVLVVDLANRERLVEAVAKAIFVADWDPAMPVGNWNESTDYMRGVFRSYAEAVLTAIGAPPPPKQRKKP